MSLITKIREGLTEYRIPKEDILNVLKKRFGQTQETVQFTPPEITTPRQKILSTIKDFPFTEEAKQEFGETKISLRRKLGKPGTLGEHYERGLNIFLKLEKLLGKERASKLAESPVAQFFNKPSIRIKRKIEDKAIEKEIVTHELLHHLFTNSPISPIVPYKTKDVFDKRREVSMTGVSFLQNFNDTWFEVSKNESFLGEIDTHLEKYYENIFNEPERLATERFSYLGAGLTGKKVEIPKKLKKYFKGILK